MIAPMRRVLSWSVKVGCAGLLAFGSTAVLAEELPLQCGSLRNHYGPFDYRTDKSKLPVVEGAHFDSGVESLTRGKGSQYIGGDIDYTLRAFPNHHRALLAMMRLAEREKASKPRGARYTDECYFLRAEYFRPDDGVVKMLSGIFLMKKGRNNEAIERLEAAKKLDSRDANLQYNLGLAYFRLGRYEESLAHAHRAYAMGFGLPGLKGLLVKAGKWRDPVPAALQAEIAQEEASRAETAPEIDAEAESPVPVAPQ